MLVGGIIACGDYPVKAPGTYKEKLDILITHLTIKGSNTETKIIECDSLYGLKDESGFVHETDSTATVALRDDAMVHLLKVSQFQTSGIHKKYLMKN